MALLTAVWLTAAITGPTGYAENYQLDNGLEVILQEKHHAPMIAGILFVKSGAKYETAFENGITHFLEHLLFDGTATLAREELDASVRDLGGYLNAYTRQDHTAFFVLLPREYIAYGLAVQADMVFNSVFPEDEMAKERNVVLEEISQSADRPGAAADAFFTARAYAHTPYRRPVLGYAPFISAIPRAAVIHYWKQYYRPSNMSLLVIGDFVSDSMKTMVEDIFGSFSDPVDTLATSLVDTAAPTHAELSSLIPRISPRLAGRQVFDTVAEVRSTYVDLSLEAPHHTDSDYYAFDLLTQYLAAESVSPLKDALTADTALAVNEVSVSLVTNEEFSRLEVRAITGKPDSRHTVLQTILEQLAAVSTHRADPEVITGLKTTAKCEQIYNSDKLHYYAFMISPLMMSLGWDAIQAIPDQLEPIDWTACQAAAYRWLVEPAYVATVVRPVEDPDHVPYVPESLAEAEITAYFDTTVFPEYDLITDRQMAYPPVDSVEPAWNDPARYHREVLANGLTTIIKSSPDSRVFAVTILAKHRTASEPDSLTGITDFVNRCFERGSLTRTAAELAADMAGIGAAVTLYDNPWIPYDDRYTTRQYAFAKFETIDEYARKGTGLLADMLMYPAFENPEIEDVRRGMLAVLGRQAGSPRQTARDLFYRMLFGSGAYARPVMGTAESIGRITRDDLRRHHQAFYSPDNLILAVSSSQPIDTVRQWLAETFGQIAARDHLAPEGHTPEPVVTVVREHVELPSEQLYLYLGGPLPGADSPDRAGLEIALAVLSERLYLNLREKQGLAYSVGAGAAFDRNFGWYSCAIGTEPKNRQMALDGILLQIDKLSLDGPTADEVRRAKNQMWGRLLRAKLSRVNQAYYLAVDEYLGHPAPSDPALIEAMSQIDVAAVQRVASRYLRTEAFIQASAGGK